MSTPANRAAPPVLSIALLSATALAYEILLMRLFSIIQWHHYAYMIISLALLGYGLSGSFLALSQGWLLRRFKLAYVGNLCLFAISSVGCFLLAQRLPFNPEEMLWDARQPLWLFTVYLLLSLPFFFTANAIALAMAHQRQLISRIYAFDLVGAGLGSLVIIGLLFLLLPIHALYLLGGIAMATALLASWELRPAQTTLLIWLGSRPAYSVAGLAVLLGLSWWYSYDGLHLSPYKELSQTLRISGSRVIAERSSPLGLISVLENPVVPLRHAPGLSLNAQQPVPAQLGLFTDGGGMSVITRFPTSLDELGYMDRMTSAVPYHLRKPQQVLVLGAGGGSEVLQALYHRVAHIDAVELNPQLIQLVKQDFAGYAGHLYDLPNVQVHIDDARGYISSNDKSFDLIQVALLDSFGAASAGVYTLNENYLYTSEALQLYLQHLQPNGYLAISRWISIPPRDTLKLFATAIDALRARGVADVTQQLLLIRSWQTSTLLIKNGLVTAGEIEALQAFCRENSFDLVYYPGVSAAEVNRYNKLQQAYFYNGTQTLLSSQRQGFMRDYKFNLSPATDDRPYFFNFFKWSTLPEIVKLRQRGGMALLESGYLVLIAIFIQALLASLVLILLPQWLLWRRDKNTNAISPSRVVIYFSALGLAFLFIEIAFMQRFILFLHHPLYAASVVLSSFLVFAGLGSAWSKRQRDEKSLEQKTRYAVFGIAGLCLLYLFTLGPLFEALMLLPLWGKIPLAILLIAPLAFCMGVPFPAALTRLGEIAASLIPWAWGINGCASVLSAVLATLIAIHAGFSTVIITAVLLYFIAAISFPKQHNHEDLLPD